MINKISPFTTNNTFKAAAAPQPPANPGHQNVVLIIPDGWGIGEKNEYNPIYTMKQQRKLKFFFDLVKNNPYAPLLAHGEDVGLPLGQMGNSEVGHLTIGAGRVVFQDLAKISRDIRIGSKDFFENPAFLKAIKHVKDRENSALHLMGLVSDGGVHSSMDHLEGLIDLANKHGIKKVYVHAFLDGRDNPDPKLAKKFVKQINEKLEGYGMPSIVSLSGRYYAMDRDKKWERVEKAYNNLLSGDSFKLRPKKSGEGDLDTYEPKNLIPMKPEDYSDTAEEAIQKAYDQGFTDEEMPPIMIGKDPAERQKHTINDGDATIFFNFRTDRPKEISEAITNPKYETDATEAELKVNDRDERFTRKKVVKDLCYICMTEYDPRLKLDFAYAPPVIDNTLGKIVSQAEKSQIRIAESEKKTHVGSADEKSFFDGQEIAKYPGMDKITIQSPKVNSFADAPKMSAAEVAKEAIKAIDKQVNLVVLNFANPDMVGHTGNQKAAEEAVVEVNHQMRRVVNAATKKGYATIVVADHGNVERMYNPPEKPGEEGAPHKAHTVNKVPCILVNYKDTGETPDKYEIKLKQGGLSNIAATVLQIMGINKPDEMNESLIERKLKDNSGQNEAPVPFLGTGKLNMVG